ncbi:MAG: methyltransferase [Deltaproteobacteria bacterium]|nr:methyltransferase [Deltaproteobacteria bacterium]
MEKEKLPWKRCYFRLQSKSIGEGSVVEISPGGFYAEVAGDVPLHQTLPVRIELPYRSKPVKAEIHVLSQQPIQDSRFVRIEAEFVHISEKDRKFLRNFALHYLLTDTLQGFQKEFDFPPGKNLKPVRGDSVIHSILKQSKDARVPVTGVVGGVAGGTRNFFEGVIDRLEGGRIYLRFLTPGVTPRLKLYQAIYLSFELKGINHFFESFIQDLDGDLGPVVSCPDLIYVDRRREPREEGAEEIEARLTLQGGKVWNVPVEGWSESGFSIVVEQNDFPFEVSEEIQSCELLTDAGTLLEGRGIVKSRVPWEEGDAKNRIRVGIEIEKRHGSYRFYRETFTKLEEGFFSKFLSLFNKAFLGIYFGYRKLLTALGRSSVPIEIVRYKNEKGQEIVGILNKTWAGKEKRHALIVIIPPAYARRKETTFALAHTIIQNFKRLGKEAVVIRYDGINQLGESYRDLECNEEGKELYHFELSQMVDDLLTTIRFVEDNDTFGCDGIVLVSFSLTSVPARKVILEEGERIKYWIAPMGASDAQDLIQNVTGGIDYLGDYAKGKRFGDVLILGYSISENHFGPDAVRSRTIFLEDAVEDMKRIFTPITWICGKYDYWVNSNRVRHLMSVSPNPENELVEVPTGHLVKTSDEALSVFSLIVKQIWKHLYRKEVNPLPLGVAQAIKIHEVEMARVRRNVKMDYKRYWTRHLLGGKNGKVGFDVLMFSKEYPEFLLDQTRLVLPRVRGVIGDIGCGTGNLVQVMLSDWIQNNRVPELPDAPAIISVDFVEQALTKAEKKHRTLLEKHGLVGYPLAYYNIDLEANGGLLKHFEKRHFSTLIASLVVSYLKKPEGVLSQFYKLLRTGGQVIISTLKPDADLSPNVIETLEKIKNLSEEEIPSDLTKEELLDEAKSYINNTSSVFNYEDKGVFRFYRKEELVNMLLRVGFRDISVIESCGNPSQAYIVVGKK